MSARLKHRLVWFGSVLFAFLCLYWALKRVDLSEVLLTLHRITLWQITLLFGLNGGIVALFSARWSWLLRLQDVRLPFGALLLYRLSGFGVSYFTPGPQFGGEPWQIYLIHRRHNVPVSSGVSSLALDKLLELLANFSFLTFGLTLAVLWGLNRPVMNVSYAIPLAGLLLFPLLIILALGAGILPAAYLLRRFPAATALIQRLLLAFAKAEQGSAEIIRTYPVKVILLIAYSLLVWVVLVGEYWLTLRFFGVELGLNETILALTAARLAFLTPVPGGFGALEASQIFAMQALGFDGSLGLSISLFIRARDILFAGSGLLLGAVLIGKRSNSLQSTPSRRELIDLNKESER